MIPFGSLFILINPKGKRYIRKLQAEETWHSNDGAVSAKEIHEANFGEFVHSSQNVPMLLEEATLQDILLGIKRQTQIIYPKDIAYICLRLGAGEGRTIAEAGCGSGGLTLALSWFGGSTGKIVSHDAREEFVKLARRNLEWAGLGSNVELYHQDIQDGFKIRNADALFLDVREPWLYLEQVGDAVKAGATIGFLLPTINQVSQLLFALEDKAFGAVEVEEILLRQWKTVPDRVRPKDRMAAHTGFLVFCRQQKAITSIAAQQNLGTRERKQKEAWEKRHLAN